MKLTKETLRRIIKEEYQKLILEQEDWAGSEIERERRRVGAGEGEGAEGRRGPLPDVEPAQRIVAARLASLWKIMVRYGEQADPVLDQIQKIIQHLNAREFADAVSGVKDLTEFLEMIARPTGDGGVGFFGYGGDHSFVLTAMQKLKSALDVLQLGETP